mgnify:CR=1 FL=1
MARQSIKKNTVFSAIKTFSSIIFPLITFPYISRVLLTDNVGKINFGLSIVSYFTLIASLGITTYAIRECSAVRDDKALLSRMASQVYSINIITTVIAYLALAITLLCYRNLDNYRTLIIIQSLSILTTTLGTDWLNSAMEDFKYLTLRTVAFQLVSLVLMFMFVHKPEDYMKYVVISLVSSAGANVMNMWYRKRYCNVRLTKKIEWRRHFIPIMYLFVMILAQTIFNSVDSTMLGLFHGDYEVGIYSTAHKMTNVINQVIGSLLWVIMPRMSYYFAENNYDEVNRLLRKVLGFNFLLGLPCAVGCFVIAEDVIMVAAGEAFIEAAPVLQILMIGFVFSLVGGNFLGNAILLPSKQEKYYMIVCCVTAVVNVIGNYIFIPLWGVKAAAGTTALCGLVILILLLFKVDERIKIEKVGKLIVAPFLGSVGIVVVCLLCKMIDDLWIRVSVSLTTSIGLYCIVQLLFRNELFDEFLLAIRKRLASSVEH